MSNLRSKLIVQRELIIDELYNQQAQYSKSKRKLSNLFNKNALASLGFVATSLIWQLRKIKNKKISSLVKFGLRHLLTHGTKRYLLR